MISAKVKCIKSWEFVFIYINMKKGQKKAKKWPKHILFLANSFKKGLLATDTNTSGFFFLLVHHCIV